MVEERPDNLVISEGDPAPKKKRKLTWWKVLIDVTVGLLLVATCLVSADLIYLNVAFNESFFVNGMSMYPTLNGTGQRLQSDGSYRALTWNDRSNIAGDIVDYGRAKTGDKGNWRASLTRLDIVVSYYADDYENGVLKSGAEAKIKRVIGMPGETLTFEVVDRVYDASGKGGSETVGGVSYEHVETFSSDWNCAWGKTTIVSIDGTSQVLRPLYSEADYPDIGGLTYPNAAIPGGALSQSWTLGADEYFLMGDNRGGTVFSQDSRSKGPVTSSMIIGKAFLITSQRRLSSDAEGNLKADFDLGLVKWPWQYIHLDRH